jgi:ubiquinone/menaquinone biosynthesis C-methylase UbiE
LSESRFDRTADLYADAARSNDWSAFVEWCRPQPGQRALDVGAGPGLLSAALSGVVAEAVALDPSQALLGHAPAGVRAVVGNAEAMPFEDAEFDLVTSVNSLHHVADLAGTLAEMVRVLAPGGSIVVQDYLADADPERAERWETVERLRDPGHRRLPREGEVADLLASHGLAREAEMRWSSTWQVEPWLTMSATPIAQADEVRRMIGADSFSMTAWRARFAAAVSTAV